jgi:hypothetical protein
MLGRTDIHIHKLTVQSTTAQIKKRIREKKKKRKGENVYFVVYIWIY